MRINACAKPRRKTMCSCRSRWLYSSNRSASTMASTMPSTSSMTRTSRSVGPVVVVFAYLVPFVALMFSSYAWYRLWGREQVASYVADVVRSEVPKMTMDQVFENKDAIAHAVSNKITEPMKNFGWVSPRLTVEGHHVVRSIIHTHTHVHTHNTPGTTSFRRWSRMWSQTPG